MPSIITGTCQQDPKATQTISVLAAGKVNGNVTLILLTSKKWRAPASFSKWQMGFNSAFKGLITFTMYLKFLEEMNGIIF
jgi:hypothetical protein